MYISDEFISPYMQVLTLLIFSLPELWPTYKTVLYPHIFPYLLPAINIALTGILLVSSLA